MKHKPLIQYLIIMVVGAGSAIFSGLQELVFNRIAFGVMMFAVFVLGLWCEHYTKKANESKS